MSEFAYELRIPKERIAVLIGKDGAIKKEIEEATHTKLTVDSKEGDVFVRGDDALNLYITRDLIRAIGRGVNPDIALSLLKQDYLYEAIDITDFAKTTNHLIRLRGRVIGKEGKSRKTIEELTECHICIYGKTISIIGETEKVALAKRAIESILRGSPHSSVYLFLEKQRRKMKMEALADKSVSF